jgi:formylglycine-generating enzyme required for sulfatase activity
MKLKTAGLMILLITLITLLSACSGGGGGASATANTSASKQGVVFTLGKSALVSAKTAGKRANALTMDAAAKYASVTVTDASGATVLQDYKTDIYTLNDSYITATIPLPPGTYNLTQFFVLDDSNHILYLVPTQTAADNIKSLVTTLLPIGFSVAKDIANTIAVQIVPVGAGSASDYGYPSVIFDVVNTTTMMISVQTLDATAKNWLLIDAALKLNDTDFALPAQQTSVLQVAKADNYTLVVSKSGYITKTVTLTAAEAVKYQTYPLVVVLVLDPTPPFDPITGIVMTKVTGGTYTMGNTFGDAAIWEQPHQVTVGDFYIGKYEVTQGQWQAVMGSNPSYFSSCGTNCPVERVSWDDIQIFITKLNQMSGKSYRLPTGAEWEYAARSGGKDERYSGGSDVNAVAWYLGNSDSTTHQVGQKQANGLGLYDMTGNLWEWVNDLYGSNRVLRGGGWSEDAVYLRASYIGDYPPNYRDDSFGFRLAAPAQ